MRAFIGHMQPKATPKPSMSLLFPIMPAILTAIIAVLNAFVSFLLGKEKAGRARGEGCIGNMSW